MSDLDALFEEGTVAGDLAVAAAEEAETFVETLKRAWEAQLEAVRTWWTDLPARQKSIVGGGALGGAVVGLLLGLVLPKVAASLQTALAGALLIFGAGRVLAERYTAGTEYLPGSPRSVILTVGLITVLGVLIQWAIFRKRADQ